MALSVIYSRWCTVIKNQTGRTASRGEIAIGLIVVAGLILILVGGGVTTQYLRTQVLAPPEEIQKDFTFTVPNDPTLIGEHAVSFTVTDGIDVFQSDPVTVVVTAPNTPPIVSAGDDVTVRMPLEITLSGSATDDGLPNIPGDITTEWSKESGPGNVSFTDTTTLETTVSFSVAGSYVLRLTANDGKVIAYDELTVTVEPAPPAPDLSLEANKTLMAVNNNVVISVKIASATPFANWAQYLEFDNTKLELVDQQAGDYSTFIADTRGLATINSTGQVRAGGFGLANNNSGAGSLGIFTFKAIGEGQTTIITEDKSSSNLFGNAISETDGYEILPDIISGEVSLNILAGNTPPTLSAGGDQQIQLPTNSIDLRGSVSDDGLPQPPGTISTQWSKVSGAGDVSFNAVAEINTVASFSAADVYILRLTADDGEFTISDDITVTVDTANQAPVAVNDAYTLTQDEALTIGAPGVLGNDSDPDGDALTVVDVLGTSNGRIDLNDNGSFTYTPNAGFYGQDQAQYKVYDGSLKSADYVIVEFNVEQLNEPPAVFAGEDQNVNLPNAVLLSGSVTDDGLPGAPNALSSLWSKVSGPGDVFFDAANTESTNVTFGVAGTYVLGLTADDGELTTSDEMTVIVNTLPIGVNDSYEIWQAEKLAVSAPGILENDADGDGDALSVELISNVGGGALLLDTNGSFSYTSAADFRGVDSFTYTASDGLGSSSEITVEITVKVRNAAPQVSAGDDQLIAFPSPATLTGSVVDDGEPMGSSLTLLWTKISGPGEVTFGNGNLVNTTASFSAAGLYELRLLANDGELTAYDELKIDVNSVPTVVSDSYEVLRGQLLAIRVPGVLENDTDVDGDTLTAELINNVQLGVLDLKNDGSFTYIYEPSNGDCSIVGGPSSAPISCDDPTCNSGPCKKSAPWQDSFTYLADDGKGQSETTVVNIVISVSNAAPVVIAGEDQVVSIVDSVFLSGKVTDDALPVPPEAVTTQWMMVSGPGAVTFSDANLAETTAEFTQPGEYLLRLSASDGEFLAADEIIVEVNNAPLVDAGEDVKVLINEEVVLDGLINDDGIPKNPGVMTTKWDQVSGPADAIFNDVLTATTGVVFSVPGEYVLRLTADDSHMTAFDEVVYNAAAKYAEITIPGQTRYNVHPGETIEIPFEVKTNIIDVGRLLITMTKNIYFSVIE